MRTKNMNRNSFLKRLTVKKLFSVGVIGCLTLGCISTVSAGSLEQARRMHDRLAGVPPTTEVLNAMAALIATGDPDDEKEAAKIAIIPGYNGVSNDESVKAFYSVSLKNFVTPWTNVEQSVHEPLNDYSALVIGVIRDFDVANIGFDQVLYGDIAYVGTGSPPELNNNSHYETLENSDADLSNSAVLQKTTQTALSWPGAIDGESAGVITTRAAGLAFFKDGTNRRMWRFTAMNYLCRDMEQLKDTTGVPDRIRQDVSRSPGGDSSIFLNSCIGCHIGMDPLTGAYAHFNYIDDTPNDGIENGSVTFSTTIGDGHKYLINSGNFEHGYVTTDNSWENYWYTGPNAKLNWAWGAADPDNPTKSGNGPKTLGKAISESEAFAQCQVEKVYKFVCLQDPIATDDVAIPNKVSDKLKTITTSFRDGGYDLREVFASVAPMCMGD